MCARRIDNLVDEIVAADPFAIDDSNPDTTVAMHWNDLRLRDLGSIEIQPQVHVLRGRRPNLDLCKPRRIVGKIMPSVF